MAVLIILNNIIMLCAQIKHEEQSGGELDCFKKTDLYSCYMSAEPWKQ